MSPIWNNFFRGCLLCSAMLGTNGTPHAGAQAIAAGTAPTATVPPSLHVTPVMGLNFVLGYTAQHDSATGWTNVLSPDLSYRFNRLFSVDASVPWYARTQAFVPVKTGSATVDELKNGNNLLGDTAIAGHLELAHKDLTELLSTSVAFPTGNTRYGLSANTTTYNVTNHVDYSIGWFTPDVEFGVGDSSTLANQTVKRIYTAVGPLANFQAGSSIDLPLNMSLDLEAYEELPIGNQKVYGTVTRKNKKGKSVTRQVLEGTGAAEDNGLSAELDVPLGHHLMLNGSYTRSLIQRLDTAAMGITWTARAPKIPKVD